MENTDPGARRPGFEPWVNSCDLGQLPNFSYKMKLISFPCNEVLKIKSSICLMHFVNCKIL